MVERMSVMRFLLEEAKEGKRGEAVRYHVTREQRLR